MKSSSPESEITPRDQLMVYLISGYLLRTAFKLQLFDVINREPISVSALASKIEADSVALRRLLRALCALGVFREVKKDHYVHSTFSWLLRSSSELGQFDGAFAATDRLWQAWEHLPDAVRTGKSPFRAVHGKDFYTYLSENDPQTSATFHAGMTNTDNSANATLIDMLNLAEAATIVDVGGGQGGFLRDILEHNQHLYGVLFDLAPVLADAVPQLLSGELAERCKLQVGNALQSVPVGADVHLLNHVLHNRDDESCVFILSNCAKAARANGRIIVVEILLPEDGLASLSSAMEDIDMFVTFGSGERTESHYARLFRQAGLVYIGATPTSTPYYLIEGGGSGWSEAAGLAPLGR